MKNYYIITFTKTHFKITEDQKSLIKDQNFDRIEVEGCVIRKNNIAEILDEDKYFETYPNKRPESGYNQFEDIYGGKGNQQVRQPTKRAGELMKKGFASALREQNLSESEIEKRMKRFTSGKSNKEIEYWQAVHDKYKDKDRSETEERWFQHASKKLNF